MIINNEKMSIDSLLDAFIGSLELSSAQQYKQVKNAYIQANEDAEDSWDKLSQIDNFDKLINKVDRAKAFFQGEEKKTKKSYKTYLNRFSRFLKEFQNQEKEEIGSFEISNKKLRKIFKGRLRSQDRVSGDKIWLPLDYIAKIYSLKEKKRGNYFSIWLGELAENVYVHYQDGDAIKSVKFSDKQVFLRFVVHKDEKGCNTDKYDVKVMKGINKYDALTPTGIGNKKEPMVVKSIRDIAIDHVISIDKILKDLGDSGQLRELKNVSDLFKSKHNKDLSNDEEKVKLSEIKLDDLTNDLNSIKKNGPLRLMTADYNSKKSNGETFSKIIKKDNDVWGILVENIYDKGNEKQQMTLCQKLTNTMEENGRLCIFPQEDMEGEDVKEQYICSNNIDFI